MGTTYKGLYEPAVDETGWGTLVNANWTLLGDREELVRKTSDETVTSSTTLQNDNDLVYTMIASHTWAFKLVFRASSAAGSALKCNFTAPSGATWYALGSTHGSSGTSMESGGSDFATAGLTSGGRLSVIEGIVTCSSTAGNFQFQWAQVASSGTALAVHTNSHLLMKLLV